MIGREFEATIAPYRAELHAYCFDDATDEELARAPIHFADGRNDNWDASPEHCYL